MAALKIHNGERENEYGKKGKTIFLILVMDNCVY